MKNALAHSSHQVDVSIKWIHILLIFQFISFLKLPDVMSQSVYSYTNVSSAHNIQHSLNSTDGFGSGAGFFDFNNDGWDDLTLIRENDSIHFYINNQGSFVPAGFNIYNAGETKCVLWVDYDNDEDYDLFITTKNGVFRLLNNNGAFNFTDVTISAGLLNNPSTNFGASFGDIDNDGYLDLYVCRYRNGQMTSPTHPDEINLLFRNNGNGTFSDISVSSGTYEGHLPSFQAVFFDFDKDGLLDIYVINDRHWAPNSLFKNLGNLQFTNVAASTNSEVWGQDPMSNTVADFNNDGWLDIYMSNSGNGIQPGVLLVNYQGQFTDEAATLGVNIDETSWGCDFIDLENDGYQDLIVTTEFPIVRNFFYRSINAQSFILDHTIFNNPNIASSYAVAKGDINNDGFSDMIIQNNSPVNSFLWQNSGGTNHFVKITLRGTVSNKMAVGAWIYVYANQQCYSKQLLCGENYMSQNTQHHIFGLGQSSLIDSVVVKYPSGVSDSYVNLNANQHYYFIEGETNINTITVIGNTTLCTGDTVWLDAGAGYSSYLWNTGWNQQLLPVTQSGTFSVETTDNSGFTLASNSVVIVVVPQPAIAYTVIAPSCYQYPNGKIILDIQNNTNNFDIIWSDSQTGSIATNLTAGNYSYQYSDEFGCSSSEWILVSDPLPINMQFQLLYNADSTANLQWLISGGTPPYQTELNGQIVNSSVNNLSSGDYELIVTDDNQCSDTTLITVSIPAGFLTHSAQNIYVFPNPVTGNLIYISGSENITEVLCHDLTGRRIKSSFYGNFIRMDENFKGGFILSIITDQGIQRRIMQKE
jgi:hypothetical protein